MASKLLARVHWRWVASVGLVMLCTLVIPGSFADASKHSKKCRPKGSKTLLSTTRIRVYMYANRTPILACHLRNEREVWIGSRYKDEFDQEQADVRHIRIVGDLIAYESYINERSNVVQSVTVKNLRSGKLIWGVPSGQVPGGSDPNDGAGRVRDLEISSKGNVAFILRPTYIGAPAIYEIYKADDSAKGLQRLDAGGDIESGSLAYSGGRIYWTKAGQPYSATLR